MLRPFDYYTEQKEYYTALQGNIAGKIKTTTRARLLVAIIIIGMSYFAIRDGESWQWLLVAANITGFIILVRIHASLLRRKAVAQLHIEIADGELQALQGQYSRFADGATFADSSHPYSFDLDIFGKGSVYQMLCRTVTHGGASLLARRLQTPITHQSVIQARQSAIAELSQEPALLCNFRVAGMLSNEGKDDQHQLTGWLHESPVVTRKLLLRIAVVLMPILSVAGITLSIIQGSMHPLLGFVVPLNWLLLGIHQGFIKRANIQVARSASLVAKYEALLQTVAGRPFTDEWLRTAATRAQHSLHQITRLKKLVNMFDSRNNGMVGPLMNTFFLFDIYCLTRLEHWRARHKDLLLVALQDMVAMDALASCATYAYNHPENIYPQVSDDTHAISANNLKHPLLPSDTAVGNTFTLGIQEQVYLLTGANMTGKSTFIRTIGVNIVMAYIGLPLPADSMSLPLLQVYSSIRVTDSVQDDVSYFKAELNRIGAIMNKVRESGALYFIMLDEPLRGTNSTDKQLGTRAIINSFLQHNVIGIVATHDTGLGNMAEINSGRISNYHFESVVKNDGLVFDFKLKPGVSTSNNATILMQQMGII